MSVDRRQMLLSLGSLPFLKACTNKDTLPPAEILGAEASSAHLLRTALPRYTSERRTRVLIIGAGTSGGAAAYTFRKAGFKDFAMVDLAETFGGNARSGGSADKLYPWGAHYLPQPDHENHELLAFLEDAGALKDGLYNEDYLCHDQEDRIYFQGSWHEGLIPWKSLRGSEREDVQAFLAFTDKLRLKRDRFGKRIFRIPLDESSQEDDYLALDKLTFRDFVIGQGWHSPFLHWYLNYCCRDDYGTDWAETSAWAGLHYFAARAGDGEKVLTWPEGNHWLIKQLMLGSESLFEGGQLGFALKQDKDRWIFDSYKANDRSSVRWIADRVILAVPRFVAARLLPELAYSKAEVSYAPWMVANLRVKSLPDSSMGSGLAWDNVPYGSPSLGYVVSNHQSIERYPSLPALTSYWPLTGGSSDYLRAIAGLREPHDWARLIVADFESMHPGYRSEIERISIWLWGHGMIQPKPGYIWGKTRRTMHESGMPGLELAHSDISGISIFEEAFSQGTRAAKSILRTLV